MSRTSGKSRIVKVALPEEAFQTHPWDAERIADELRVLWLLEQVRERRLGHGKAAGLPRACFLLLMGQHRISAFDHDPDELSSHPR